MTDKKKITKTYSIEEQIFNRFDEICRQKNINRSKFIEKKINEFILENWSVDQNKMYSLPGSDDYVKIVDTNIENGNGYVKLNNGNKLKLADFELMYTEEVIDPDNFLNLGAFNESLISATNEIEVDDYIKNDHVEILAENLNKSYLNSDSLPPISELNKINDINVELGGVILNDDIDQIDPSFLNKSMMSINDIEKVKEIIDKVDIKEHLENHDYNVKIKVNGQEESENNPLFYKGDSDTTFEEWIKEKNENTIFPTPTNNIKELEVRKNSEPKEELMDKYEFTEDLKSIYVKDKNSKYFGIEYKLVDLYNIDDFTDLTKFEMVKFAMTHPKIRDSYFTDSNGRILFQG